MAFASATARILRNFFPLNDLIEILASDSLFCFTKISYFLS